MKTAELRSCGYYVTSRKGLIATRIDRPDWLEFMLEQGHSLETSSRGQLADQYRRVYFNDKVRISPEQLRELSNSNFQE